MKTILVPTDYSEVAENALQYAIELARFSKTKLVLLHVYQLPMPSTEVPIVMITPQDLEKENLKKMEKLRKKIAGKTQEIQIESVVRTGFTVEEIRNEIREKNADLVVMGVTGTTKATEAVIGSHTSSLMKQTHTPILVVPKDARFKEVEKMALAYNYNEEVNTGVINTIKTFAKLFNAKILVLDVEKPVAIPIYEDTTAGETLEKSLKDVEHAMFYTSAEDITDGINEFVDDHNCDWVVMIPHKHTFPGNLFYRSHTKRMAFHTHVPLLSIHD